VSWQHRPEYRFAVDGKDYAGMDGPSVVCRRDEYPCKSGYYMSFTATPPGCNPASGANMTGKCGFGLAESDDGLRWR
jgi:hypothetical protein